MALQTDILCLSLAYVLLSLLLLLVLTRLALPRAIKVAAILAVSAFYVVVFFATQNLLGWSAPVAVPDRFKVLWTRVVEPDPSRQQPGGIHLWLEELDEANLPSGVPRAYLLPYTPQLAERVSGAQDEIQKGHPQGGRALAFGGAGGATSPEAIPVAATSLGVAPGGDPSGGGVLDPAFLGGQSKTVELAPLPQPALPQKDTP